MSARTLGLLLVVVLASGCAHYPLNARLTAGAVHPGYRFPPMDDSAADPRDELFVCLSFSGGGTRAAALAYGALVKLRDTDIGHGGGPRSFLDEVDCIAGISGGAFTAAYFGLFGSDTFERVPATGKSFPERFLNRDIEKELALAALNPVNLVRLASPYFGRSDLAAELYDRTVFEGETFAALVRRPRPFIILHATSMADGARFEFTQDVFDFLGSDLTPFPVARSAAASSAFPFLLTPVSLRSYPPPAGFVMPTDVTNALGDREINPARYNWARHQLDLMTKDHEDKWVHLLDGGLSDNIGLRSIVSAYDRSGGFIGRRINAGRIKRLVWIAINARTDPPEHLSREGSTPGLPLVFMKTATVSMENMSFDTIESAIAQFTARDQAQRDIQQCNERLTACRGQLFDTFARDVRTCFLEVDFEALPSPAREELLAYPTTLALPPDKVKRLIDVAGTLLDGSVSFQKLLRALRGEPALGQGIGESGNCS